MHAMHLFALMYCLYDDVALIATTFLFYKTYCKNKYSKLILKEVRIIEFTIASNMIVNITLIT